MAAYQNEDGGFGHALEPDCWNPDSSPVQTWTATEIINEIDPEDKSDPIIQGILKYLSSGKDFDGHTWATTVATNNDHPHAPWWTFVPPQEISYNPTACLIGFIIKFADRNSDLFDLACMLAKEAYDHFKDHFPMDSMHTVSCFVKLYEYMKESTINDLLDMDEFRALLSEQIRQVITYDTSIWPIDYVCKPSLFIGSKTSDFYLENKEICDYECEFISNTQNADGTWNITWSWNDYPEQWSISKNWWKSDWFIKNLRYVSQLR